MIPISPVGVIRGDGPLVLGMPHVGTWVPPAVWARLNANGRRLADTDWHVDRLYEGLAPTATVVMGTVHRYVIDPNRDPEDLPLYPGAAGTRLLPVTDLDGRPIWEPGQEPDGALRRRHLPVYHTPYHLALRQELVRVRAQHGVAVLVDCHSIRGHVPRLFPGRLPDINIGDDFGRTCDPPLSDAAVAACEAAGGRFSWTRNGRFRGGWSVRHHGRPVENVHALQIEMVQALYLESETPPFAYDPARAEAPRALLADLLDALDTVARTDL